MGFRSLAIFTFLFFLQGRGILAEEPVFNVSSSTEFVKSIGSNRKIHLAAGTYLLDADADAAGNHPHITFKAVHDGVEPVIKGVTNLTIKGAGASRTHLLVSPRYATVLTLKNSKDIRLSDISLGHTEGGECTGGVFKVDSSNGITLSRLILSGSGTIGLITDNVQNLHGSQVEITECNTLIASFKDSQSIILEDGIFHKNEGGFQLKSSSGVTVENSSLHGNSGHFPLFDLDANSSLTLKDSKVLNNRFVHFSNEQSGMHIHGGRILMSGRYTGSPIPDTFMPEILRAGEYHADEVNVRTGDEWFGLFLRKEDGLFLKRATIVVEQVFDAVMDVPGETSGKRISSRGDDEPLFYLRGIPGLREGKVSGIANEHPHQLYPGMAFPLSNAQLVATGNASVPGRDDAIEHDGISIRDYQLNLQRMDKSRFVGSSTLLTLDHIDIAVGPPGVLFSGDLDGDGYQDLLLSTSGHYNLSQITLYLSSASEDPAYPVAAAVLNATGC